MLALLFFLPLALVIYHLFLFPAGLLAKASRVKDPVYPLQDDESLPTIDLLIAARNEATSIQAKLTNSLELDYPANKLRIVVLANGCTDGTVDLVRAMKDRGIVLQEYGAIGKTEAQNLAAAASDADILVFSDANTLYNPEALRHLAAPFQDPTVGSVSGRHTYVEADRPSGAGEKLYWNLLETSLKKAESATGGLIGANGSIYAVRRELYVPLDPDVISDFFEPLMVASKGFRCVYAPDAVSMEEPETSFELEYRRKVRIVRRTVYGLLKNLWLLDPTRTGRLSGIIISHKVLRWLTPLLLLVAFTAATLRILRRQASSLDFLFFSGMSLAGFLAILGRGLGREQNTPVLTQAYYVYMVFRAAVVGVYEAFAKGQYTIWDHGRSDG